MEDNKLIKTPAPKAIMKSLKLPPKSKVNVPVVTPAKKVFMLLEYFGKLRIYFNSFLSSSKVKGWLCICRDKLLIKATFSKSVALEVILLIMVLFLPFSSIVEVIIAVGDTKLSALSMP